MSPFHKPGSKPRRAPLSEERVMHAMTIDDSYHVIRTLAEGPGGLTQCVTIDDAGPFVRKKIPLRRANRSVWAALADCDCPRVPRIAATYEMPDCFVVVYDFVPGSTLDQEIESNGPLAPDQAIQVVQQIAEALDALHESKIVHCDVTPRNVVMAADGAHLIDLGIAQIEGCKPEPDAHPLGTWGFAAPEQCGFAPVDSRTDVYALARLLGFLLCGADPSTSDYDKLLSDPDVVPPLLKEVVEQGSALEPSARFTSAKVLAKAAVAALEGEASAEAAFTGSQAATAQNVASSAQAAAAQAASSKPSAQTAPAERTAQTNVANPDTPDNAETPKAEKKGFLGRKGKDDRKKKDKKHDEPEYFTVHVDPNKQAETSRGAQASASYYVQPGTAHSPQMPFYDPEPQQSAPSSNVIPAKYVLIGALIVLVVIALNLGFILGGLGKGDGGSQSAATPSISQSATTADDSAASDSASGESESAGDSGGSSAPVAAPEENPLVITEFGWSPTNNGYAYFAFGLRNNSDDTAVQYPAVMLVGRDKAGNILFTSEEVLNRIEPGETQYHGFVCGNGTKKPASIDIEVEDPDGFGYISPREVSTFSFGSTHDTTNSYGETTFAGEVTYKGSESKTDAAITLVLRDKRGNIIYGDTTFVDGLKNGQPKAFDMTEYDLPDYASYELYGKCW